jgi:maleylacetoacetate isomerase/maleylpyruvate isomerase
MTSSDRFELFTFWRSSATYRVRVACNLKGIARRETNVDIDAGEQHGEAFRRVNPLGGIPALIDHGAGESPLPITQSLAILEFLDETHPQPPLLPADAHGRARVRSIAQMLTADTHPLITPRVRNYLTTTEGFDTASWRAWQIQWFGTGLRAVEARLAAESATGRFCHGDQPGLADICLASLFTVMRVFKIDFDDIPTCKRVMAECEALEAFAAADPMRQVGAPG